MNEKLSTQVTHDRHQTKAITNVKIDQPRFVENPMKIVTIRVSDKNNFLINSNMTKTDNKIEALYIQTKESMFLLSDFIFNF